MKRLLKIFLGDCDCFTYSIEYDYFSSYKLKLSICRNYKYKHAISSNIIPPIKNIEVDDSEDTYGAPRPGGRKHQGIDLLCDYGTELLSVIDGSNQEPSNIFLIEKNR